MDAEPSAIEFRAEYIGALPAKLRNRLLQHYLRWGRYAEALDCLAYLNVDTLVTQMDMQAQALLGLGRTGEALAVIQRRLEQNSSQSATLQLGYCLLAHGQSDAALEHAQQLTRAYSASYPAWGLLGDVHLQRGELDAAAGAYVVQQQLSASVHSRVGLMQVYRARGDMVTAAAYAVAAAETLTERATARLEDIAALRAFFAETADVNWTQRLDALAATRRSQETEELRTALEALLPQLSPRPARRQEEARLAAPAAPPPNLGDIPVEPAERTRLEQAARRLFGFEALRPGQAEIMACMLRGEHVLAVLPTGAGKSLCYQLPAFLDEEGTAAGLTVVISPLIALMLDQMKGLPPVLRERTAAINSLMDGDEARRALERIAAGECRLLYVAPERLRQRAFLHAVRQAGVARLVVDEAHCISAWGHDFRPDYLFVAQAHRDMGSPPVLAMTATAPPRVAQDIELQLFGPPAEGRPAMRRITGDTFRANLGLCAFKAADQDEKLNRLLALCKALEGSGIVYARTRSQCEEIAGLLVQAGESAEHYHAGIDNRPEVQARFMKGETRIIVATIAFGMGVDKPDIRFILHYGLPDSVEAYYQEAGRAGRDGLPATCALLYSNQDRTLLTRRVNRDMISRDALADLYALVRRMARAREGGLLSIPADDLARETESDDTRVRVALSVLEQAGLLRRRYDAPRALTLRLTSSRSAESDDKDFQRFAAAAALSPHSVATRDYMELAAATGVSPGELDERLLGWREAGRLEAHFVGYNLLLELLPPPADSKERVPQLLDRYEAIQRQRVAEIAAYAATQRCRHGHIANYLGGLPRGECAACDRCGAVALPEGDGALHSDAEQERIVLAALGGRTWGYKRLIRTLRGQDEGEMGNAAFGQLSYRSERGLRRLIDGLVERGLLELEPYKEGFTLRPARPAGRAGRWRG